uniref:Uncharacterized protein n=1 Tax=Anopheles merus TaxID=30066 RepID=A0A182V1W2_ANOME
MLISSSWSALSGSLAPYDESPPPVRCSDSADSPEPSTEPWYDRPYGLSVPCCWWSCALSRPTPVPPRYRLTGLPDSCVLAAAAAAAAACCDRFSSEPAAPASDAGGRAGWPAVSYAADGDDVDGSRNPKLLPKPKPCVPSRPGERKAASVNAWYPVRTGSSGLYGSVPGGWAGAGSVQRRRDGEVE